MSKKMKQIPKLRFANYDGEWTNKSLGEFIETAYQGINTAADKVVYADTGVPILQSKHITNGEIEIDKARFLDQKQYANYFPKYRPQKKDILFANIGTIGPSVVVENNDKFLIAWNILKLTLKSTEDVDFIQVYLNSLHERHFFESITTGNATKFINKEGLLNISLIAPVKENERKEIGNFFKKIDQSILLHQKKVIHLHSRKKALLQKMFPAKGASIPIVRFPQYLGEWKRRQFGELYQKNTEKNTFGNIKTDQTISISTMRFKKEGNRASDESLANYKVLRKGDIAFEGHKSKEFSFGRFVLNDIGTGIMSPRFTALRPKKALCLSFWKQYIHYEPIMKHILVKSTKLGTMMNELVVEDLFRQEILVPSDEEQYAIGIFFQQLDELINLYECRILHLRARKKALLQQMFV